MKGSVTSYTLYAKRYLIGYTLLIALVVGMVTIAAVYVPNGLRKGEMEAALVSGALSFESIDPASVVNLPYYLLQRLSFVAFGVSAITIRLPSIILGVLTIIGIFILVRTWFRRNIAIIVTAIAATTAQFLFLVQDGTPIVMFPFVTVWLLVASTFVTRARYFSTLWKVVACVLMATALYIPLGIYTVIALIITASLHPHIRYVIRRVSRTRLIIAILLGVASIAPLIYAVMLRPSVALDLLGIPTSGINLLESIPIVGQNLFGFFLTTNSYVLRPLYSLGLALIICVGIYKLLTIKHTARSYTILIVSGFLVPLTLIEPAHATALYPIAMLMVAMGIATLISNWYKLFPLNPYARAAGLVPITVLVVGLVFTGSMRYLNNYTYNPNLLRFYSTDLQLLSDTIVTHKNNKPIILVAAPSERAFYGLVAHYDKRFSLGDSADTTVETTIVTREAYKAAMPSRELTTIVTNPRSGEADRFYIYKNTAQ